jgi:hypothetical protein
MEDLKLQIVDLTSSMNNIDASHRESELQSDVQIKDLNVKNERLRNQLATLQADHTKLLSDFEEFKTRARTVLKTRHEEPQEDTTILKLQVWYAHLIVARVTVRGGHAF